MSGAEKMDNSFFLLGCIFQSDILKIQEPLRVPYWGLGVCIAYSVILLAVTDPVQHGPKCVWPIYADIGPREIGRVDGRLTYISQFRYQVWV
jgi:hypothetical protein